MTYGVLNCGAEADTPLNGICGNRVLTCEGIARASFAFRGPVLQDTGCCGGFLDAGDLLVLPGIVDIHGDAFERSLRPRPDVHVPHITALQDVDSQLLSHGITTAFHGVTISWEGGLRSVPVAQGMLDALSDNRARLGADHRVHLRFETRFPEGAPNALAWTEGRKIHLLSINDHWPQIAARLGDAVLLAKFAERAECDVTTFARRVDAARSEPAISGSVAALVASARRAGLSVASHDDPDAPHRQRMSRMGCNIAEFPLTENVARQARALGDTIVFGAPNVLRGGSHIGGPGAEDMIRAGLCDVLTSDYYYPSPLLAAFELAAREVLPFAKAWALVAQNAATAVGLQDRGRLAEGQRADVIVVDDEVPGAPRVIASIVAGTLRFASRLLRHHAA